MDDRDIQKVEDIKKFLLSHAYISKKEYDNSLEQSYSQSEIRLTIGNIRVHYIKISDTILYYDFNTIPIHSKKVCDDYNKFKIHKHRINTIKRLLGERIN